MLSNITTMYVLKTNEKTLSFGLERFGVPPQWMVQIIVTFFSTLK